ncbi:conserved hypothetical protein [Tenacibaculum maritimum]|uniref:hypothetical protein n=1 Tax=Tenacibaculum maritimum TaxID=107401 RepID=UPI0012E47E7B|nr:hypothetical protein [Tenacibaculum maritimum]CAA0235665.1 conserved hypothetical protein [Tenacibaculum maritimum]
MNKLTKKRIKYNEDILLKLKKRYDYSIDFIRKSLRGDRVGEMPDILIKEYKKMEAASRKAIENEANNLNQ